MSTDAKPKPFLSLELRCACGSSLFCEIPQERDFGADLAKSAIALGTAWTAAHKAHHQEPKK